MSLLKKTRLGRFLDKTLDVASIFSPQVALINRAADALVFDKPADPKNPSDSAKVQEVVTSAALANHPDFAKLQNSILDRVFLKFDIPFISSPVAERKFKEAAKLLAEAVAIEVSQQLIAEKS